MGTLSNNTGGQQKEGGSNSQNTQAISILPKEVKSVGQRLSIE